MERYADPEEWGTLEKNREWRDGLNSVKGFLCLHFLIESVQTRSPFRTGVCEAALRRTEALQTELFSKLENVKSHFDRRPLTENRRRVKRFHSGGYILSFPVSSSYFIYP
ncbi:hypothetical protein QQF64_029616 [Cirrhinus molitorella]|uniref:Uncharacterized protein n=1 Tax=Cirrhinus molitorella TaxID=172907 RepID=A0ABR3N0Y9_9TELE